MKIAYNDKLSLGSKEWISLSKPRHVFNLCYEAWRDELVPFQPARLDNLQLAHSPEFVRSVTAFREENGFGNTRPEVLEQVLNANGAMIAATEEALRSGIVFAPVSGFHHAGFEYNGGFCTFNGLIIALRNLKEAGEINRALILDFDGHYGDGTQDIIEKLDLHWIKHLTRNRPFTRPEQAISQAVLALFDEPDIVIYQAGADSHETDPFGAGYFSDEQWKRRDKAIFKTCYDLEIPIVWNLAGGYDGKATHMLHYSTFQTAVDIFNGVGLGHPAHIQPPVIGLG
jgi:acetoin utilization deacetylase AcuC-like enzyme